MLTAPISAQTWQLGTWLLLWKSQPPLVLFPACLSTPSLPPPTRGAWKCPRLLIWDHTSPPPSPCVNKSTFLLFCPVSNGVYCKWKMARGALGCLTVLSSALQLENFLEWAPVSWLEMKTEKLFASQSTSFLNNHNRCKHTLYINGQAECFRSWMWWIYTTT